MIRCGERVCGDLSRFDSCALLGGAWGIWIAICLVFGGLVIWLVLDSWDSF